MKFDNPILFFVCSLGVFNGFLASFYFLFFSKQKRVQNLFFGLLLLMLSIRIGKSVYSIFTESAQRDRLILQIGLSACFLIGISLYYYLKASVENTKRIPKTWKIHFAVLFVLVLGIGILKPYRQQPEFWNNYFVPFIYATWGVYLALAAYQVRFIFSKIISASQKGTTSEWWLVWVLVGNILIFTAYIVGYFYFYLVGTITFSVVFYALLIFLLFKENRDNVFKDIPEKYAANKIESAEAKALSNRLHEIMSQNEFYKNSNVKLDVIAKALGLSTHKLSQLLNDNMSKSFSQFINEYRVTEAKKQLIENDQYTLESIGFEAGFSSKSTFYATFKKITGDTPAEYKKRYC